MKIQSAVYRFCELIYKGFNKIFIVPGMKASFGACGKNVRIAYDCDVKGNENIFIGNNSQIGPHSLFWTTRARIVIGNNVLMGPNITIITGDHRYDIVGKCIIDVGDDEKLPEHDGDVVIEEDVWISSNVTILKGVTIGKGSVIGAGSVVTKNIPPYSIAAGVPAKKLKDRFSQEDLLEHEKRLTQGHTGE